VSESVLNLQAGGQRSNHLPIEQRESLLTTKLFIPSIRLKRVDRPRLIEQVNRGLDKALILVSAPAGYGKTTLISTWLRENNVSSTWVSLDEGDNDPLHFLQYILTAFQRISPTIGADLLGMLRGLQPVSLDTLLNLLINDITEHAPSFVLVLDDFHIIQAQPILEMVTFLLEHMPPNMHLVLLSRTDPPIPLSRLRARNQLLDIRADQLRFTSDEIATFLNKVMELNLAASDIATLEERTEGWIAGLQLAALSMQQTKDIHGFVKAFADSHHYIMDYLAEEVLQLQPENVRLFLLKTSILERMSGSLCNAVVELEETGPFNGQVILESLEQMNLFVISLDDEKRWYRYHHLFAEVLSRHLEKQFPHQLCDLHRRASQWYEQNGFIPEAIRHALAAGNQNFAIQLIEGNGCQLMMRGEGFTLLNWIEAVEAHSEDRPWLAILQAWAFALNGYLDRVESALLPVDRFISSSAPNLKMKIMLGSMVAVRAYLANMRGDTGQAAAFAQQALGYLPDRVPFARSLRSLATSILGDASWLNGDLETARGAYTEAMRIGRAADNIHLTIIANSHIAETLIEQGQLHAAARTYAESLKMATGQNGVASPLAARVHVGLSQVSYEWNHLEAATRHVHQCIELSRQWESIEFQAVGYVMLARLEQAQCHPEKAKDAMRAADDLESSYHLAQRQSIWVRSALARLWITQGNPERAASFLQENGIEIDGKFSYLREPEYLVLLHLLLSQTDYDALLKLSECLLQRAEAANRMGQVIEVLALRALAFQGKADMDQALAALGRALSLAQSEGYVRTFLDEGVPMAKLLHQARTHRIQAGYATELLDAMGEAVSATQAPAQILIEPLTVRELEVMRLIEAGCSNQEIAAKLVVSIATVKRHISNIYAKLGVKSRTQAVALKKELRLLE